MKDKHKTDVGQWMLTRRSAVTGLLGSMALLTLPRMGWAKNLQSDYTLPSKASRFLNVSAALTERSDLDPLIANRTYKAITELDPSQTAAIEKLHALLTDGMSARELFNAATDAGLKDTVVNIQTAWYTGTVGSGEDSRLIAYKDALMYRTVEDGLVVPTYCDFGPLWWSGTPVPPSRLPANNSAS
ncbi:sugar dehydrogenase complex small subunit [Carnimonas nigrificans]|uniref:sugar dehydrogenase complex small subunit n=1 Tax=Carnimonas nigrificans TaxID=64323 RepID=UPI0004AC727D|nr:sugar dehydrogenase complex small subunit [Carnimonas nigrificans]